MNKILEKIINNINNLDKDIAEELKKESKDNIKKGKDINLKSFLANKTRTRAMYGSGNLYKSISRRKNTLIMAKYGIFLNNGTDKMEKREFVPRPGSASFDRILKKIKLGK